jgi:protein required for attachment to host cells
LRLINLVRAEAGASEVIWINADASNLAMLLARTRRLLEVTMSKSVRLPHGAWVLVADGRKALLLVNEGDEDYPDLRVEQTIEAPPNPPTRNQGADRPGRAIFSSRRSAVGQTDWHKIGEVQFAASVVDRLLAESAPSALVLAAPPAFLAELRKRLPKRIRAKVLAELDKDLTHLTVHEIERMIAVTTPTEPPLVM